MFLNLEDRTISYAINDEYLGIGARNIKNGKYRMRVSLSGNGTSIQLLSYRHLHKRVFGFLFEFA